MKKSALLLVLGLLCASTALVAGEILPPDLRLPEVARPSRVEAELTLRPDQPTFPGRVTIRLEIVEPTSILWLNANRLEIGEASLTVGEERLAATIVPGGEQFVGFDFGRELAPGPATLTIDYVGQLDAVETDGLFHQEYNGDWYVFSQFESIFARRAIPGFDEPAYRAVWQLTLNVPSELEAVSNTAVVSETPIEDGLKRVVFAETLSIPSYLVALGVGPFEYVDGGSWGRQPTPVRIVVPKGQSAKAEFAAQTTGSILAVQEEYFDLTYAFGKLDYLVIPHTVGFGAMENPGLVTYSERGILIDPATATLARKRSYASTAAHENAHMWFGDYVTMVWWDDIWLNEGFATWMGAKTLAAWNPGWWDEADRFGRRGWALSADGRPSAKQVRRPIANSDDIESAFDGISYGKGAALLQMYEIWMGEELFRDAIRAYLRQHALGNATSDDFLAALGAKSGPEVAKSFATFLDQPGLPVVTFATDCPAEGAATLTLSQRRYLPLGANVPGEQTWSIPVAATIGAGERSEPLRVILSAPSQSVALPFCPEWISGNHRGFGYYLSEYTGGPGSLVARIDQIPVGEQIALLSDSSQLVAAGSLEPAAALAMLPKFADSPHRQVVSSAITIAGSIDSGLVADEVRPNYQRFIRKLFGERAQELGWTPRPEEEEEVALLRPTLISTLGDEGEDPEVLAEARKLVNAWLEDPTAVDASMRETVLDLAAIRGDAELFDQLLARAVASQDRRERADLIGALGSFRDPELASRSLGIMLEGTFDVREAAGLLRGVSADRETRELGFEWIQTHWETLAGTLPQQSLGYMTFYFIRFCEPEQRDQVEAFFGPRLEGVPQGSMRLEQALESIDRCIDRKAAQQQFVTEFLKAY